MFESTWNRRRFLTVLGGAAATASLPSQAFAAPLLLAADSTTTAAAQGIGGRKGDRWNESRTFADTVTGRAVRQLTSAGEINEKPTYHTNTGFTADGRFCIFATTRGGRGAMCRCDVESGEIVQLTDAIPGTGGWALCAPSSGSRGSTTAPASAASRPAWLPRAIGRCSSSAEPARGKPGFAGRTRARGGHRPGVGRGQHEHRSHGNLCHRVHDPSPRMWPPATSRPSPTARPLPRAGCGPGFLQVPLAGGPAKVAAEFDGAAAHTAHTVPPIPTSCWWTAICRRISGRRRPWAYKSLLVRDFPLAR